MAGGYAEPSCTTIDGVSARGVSEAWEEKTAGSDDSPAVRGRPSGR